MQGADYIMLRERDLHAVAAERIEASTGPVPVIAGDVVLAAQSRTADSWPRSSSTTRAWCRRSPRTLDGDVLMMAWMNAETLRMTLDEGRMVYWSRSRQEVWRKGDTSGDHQVVREAYYDCDGDVLLFKVDQHGQGRLPHRRRTLLLPPLRGLSDAAAAEPGRVPRPRPRPHGRAGVGRAAGRPGDAGRRLRQARRRRPGLPARVGRARRAVEPVLVRRPRSGGHAAAARRAWSRSTATSRVDVPRDARHPRRARAPPRRRTGRRRCPSCRRCTAG